MANNHKRAVAIDSGAMQQAKANGFRTLFKLRGSKSMNPLPTTDGWWVNPVIDADSDSVMEEYWDYMQATSHLAADNILHGKIENTVSVRSIHEPDEDDFIPLDPEITDAISRMAADNEPTPASPETSHAIPRKALPHSSRDFDFSADLSTPISPPLIPGAWPESPIDDVPMMPTREPPPPPPSPAIAIDTSRQIPASLIPGGGNVTHHAQTTTPSFSSSSQHGRTHPGPVEQSSNMTKFRFKPSIFGFFNRQKREKKTPPGVAALTDAALQTATSPVPKRGVQVVSFDISLELHRLEIQHREELRRIEEEDVLLAQALQAEEEFQHDVELERQRRIKEIEETDRRLAEDLLRQEQEEIANEERRKKAAEEAREEELKRQLAVIGAPVGVRRVTANNTIVDVGHDDISVEVIDHLKNVKAAFSWGLAAYNITKVEWIINDRLREQFEKCKELMAKKGRSTRELILFHGTGSHNINSYVFTESPDIE